MALDNFHSIHTDYPQRHSVKALTPQDPDCWGKDSFYPGPFTARGAWWL